MLLAYDCLLTLLVLFPLLLGGAWIDRPGIHLELAQLGIPVLIVAIATAAIGRRRARESRVARGALRVWKAWQSALERNPARTIWLASLVVGLLWTLASLRRHWALGSGARDLAIFTGTLWNLTHGLGYMAAMKGWTNLFIDHQSPITYLIAPIFAIYPRAETLLAVQGFGLALGGVAAFYVARSRLGAKHWGVAAIPLLYWAYLPTRNANAFDFHPETLMLPLFLGGIAAFLGERRSLGIALFFGGLLGKESGGVVLCGIGMALLAQALPPTENRPRRFLGAALVVAGTALFLFQIRGVPALLGVPYAYNGEYDSYGGGLLNLALSPVLKPIVFWSHLVGPTRLKFLLWTLGALGFLPLLDWRTAIAALPCYLMLFLTDGDHRVSLYYYYAIEASIGLFWALPGGLARAESWLREKRKPAATLGIWLLFWSLALFDRGEITRIRRFQPTPHDRWLRTELVPCVGSLEIAAPSALVPHLATRPWARDLPDTNAPTRLGPRTPVDCVVLDPTIDHYPLSNTEAAELFSRLELDPGYRVAYQCGPTTVLERKDSLSQISRPWAPPWKSATSGASCLKCVPACEAP